MRELSQLLAALYGDKDEARAVLREAFLDPGDVNLDAAPVIRWERILEVAWKSDKLGEIVGIAAGRYPGFSGELGEALERYREVRDQLLRGSGGTPAAMAEVGSPGLFRYALDRWLPGLHLFLTRARVGGLKAPPERAEVVRYLRELEAGIRNDFQEKIYLPLASRPVPTSPLAQGSGKDPFISPIHQIILQLVGRAQGGDSASAQIAALNRRSRIVRDILTVLDHAEEPLILLGEPGSGKTMTLQQAAMVLARAESRRVFPCAVLFIRLGEFHVDGPVGVGEVLEYVLQSSPPEMRSLVRMLEDQQRLVVFFDGMDEMSRDRYSEHTEALSLFAGASQANTLFSCRITDFSPRFVHRRLVLLPFDGRQVAEYLARYVESFPLVVDGRSWKLGPLARRIVAGDLPIEASNPFVLWLLCLYLQEKSSWPVSRVELLQFYSERNYERKNEERSDDEPPFPDRTAMLREWGRCAHVITERNRGPAIPIELLEEGQDSSRIREALRIGKRCGVLAESKEGHEHLVRFEHQRFQEYFAARYIHEVRPAIDWLSKLDAPRWQETMLNLILLGDPEGGAVDALAEAVGDLTAPWLQPSDSHDEDDKDEEDWTEPARSRRQASRLPGAGEENETVLADRVELSSRVLRQSSGAPGVGEKLLPPFRKAVQILAERGNPITQVKMMRSCQNVAEIDFIETLRAPLQSPIDWVRKQALILMAGSKVGARATGLDLATEIGYDLANGLLPVRIPAYVKAAFTARNPKVWWALLSAVLCSALSVLLLFGSAGGIYYGIRSLGRLSGFSWLSVLGQPAAMAACAFLLACIAGIALWQVPSNLWAAILGGTVGISILVPLLFLMWAGSLGKIFESSIFLFCLYFVGVAPGTLIGAACHLAGLGLYLATTWRVRRPDHGWKAFFAAAWENCGFKEALDFGGKNLGSAGIYLAGGIAVFLLGALLTFLGRWISLPFPPLANGLIVLLALFLAGCLGHLAWKKKTEPVLQALGVTALVLGMLGLAYLFDLFIDKILFPTAMKIFLWLADLPLFRSLLRFVVLLVCLGVVALSLYLFLQLWRRSLAKFWPFRPQNPVQGAYTPQAWKADFGAANSYAQEILLLRTTHQTLSLTPAEFLALLREVAPLLKEGPALSTYWEQRDQLEQVLKQERQG